MGRERLCGEKDTNVRFMGMIRFFHDLQHHKGTIRETCRIQQVT
jgi:hypothetical protein